MGIGFGFNVGPVRVGGTFRGPRVPIEDWAWFIWGMTCIAVPIILVQGLVAMLTDSYFWITLSVYMIPVLLVPYLHVRYQHRRHAGYVKGIRGVLLTVIAFHFPFILIPWVLIWDNNAFGWDGNILYSLIWLLLVLIQVPLIRFTGKLAMRYLPDHMIKELADIAKEDEVLREVYRDRMKKERIWTVTKLRKILRKEAEVKYFAEMDRAWHRDHPGCNKKDYYAGRNRNNKGSMSISGR